MSQIGSFHAPAAAKTIKEREEKIRERTSDPCIEKINKFSRQSNKLVD